MILRAAFGDNQVVWWMVGPIVDIKAGFFAGCTAIESHDNQENLGCGNCTHRDNPCHFDNGYQVTLEIRAFAEKKAKLLALLREAKTQEEQYLILLGCCELVAL